jgi:hypothetical protein
MESSEEKGGCFTLAIAGLAIVVIVGMIAGGASVGDGGDSGGRTTTTTTNTTEVDILSDNTVRILSPDTYIYYNSGDTTTRVDGDRNNVAAQTGGGQCWVSSAQAWGACPAGAPDGSAVP